MPATWRVVNQTPRSDLAGNRFVQVMDITFEVLATGDQNVVTVPMSSYSVESVASIIQPIADNMLAVSKLGSGS